MGKDYTTYLMNKVNQYKDSDALRLESLDLARLSFDGGVSNYASYYIGNTSFTDLIIEEIICTWTISDSIFGVSISRYLEGNTTIYTGFWNNSPAIFNESNFTGTIADRTIAAGSPHTYNNENSTIQWLHGGTAGDYGSTMDVKFTNGTHLWAEAPGRFNITNQGESSSYKYFQNDFEYATPRAIKRLDLEWPVGNIALLEIYIDGGNSIWSGSDTSGSISITDFQGTIEDRSFVPQATPNQIIEFFFALTAASSGYKLDLWLEDGAYDTVTY